jgi:hypothetical protein
MVSTLACRRPNQNQPDDASQQQDNIDDFTRF